MADIELVVKIPEVEYEYLTNKEKFYSLEKSIQEWLINKFLNRVIDGTPLPKGHGRIGDLDKLIRVMKDRDEDNGGEPLNAVDRGYHLAYEHLCEEIDNLLKEESDG